jgi:hypothetical protein
MMQGVQLFAVLSCSIAMSGCISFDPPPHRDFKDELAAIRQFRGHESAFFRLAASWRDGGNDYFCTIGQNYIFWSKYHFARTLIGWKVSYPGAEDYIDREFRTLEEAAATAHTTRAELEFWQDQLLALKIECIETVPVRYRGQSGAFVELEMPQPILEYGLRYAPEIDGAASTALQEWASIPPPLPSMTMHDIGSGWFYYERSSGYRHPPFSEVNGALHYADGGAAENTPVGLNPAFGPPAFVSGKTDAEGHFRVTWLPAGRYRVSVDVFDPSIPGHRRWYYPGVLDPDRASEIVVSEEQAVNLPLWTIPRPPLN